MIYTFFTSDLCSINHYIFKTFKYRYLIKFLRKSRKKTINNPEIQNLKKMVLLLSQIKFAKPHFN